MELKRISLGLMLIVTAVVSACSGESEPPASRFEVAKGGDDRNGPYDVIQVGGSRRRIMMRPGPGGRLQVFGRTLPIGF